MYIITVHYLCVVYIYTFRYFYLCTYPYNYGYSLYQPINNWAHLSASAHAHAHIHTIYKSIDIMTCLVSSYCVPHWYNKNSFFDVLYNICFSWDWPIICVPGNNNNCDYYCFVSILAITTKARLAKNRIDNPPFYRLFIRVKEYCLRNPNTIHTHTHTHEE